MMKVVQQFGSGFSKMKMVQSRLKANNSFARKETGTTWHPSVPGVLAWTTRTAIALDVRADGLETE